MGKQGEVEMLYLWYREKCDWSSTKQQQRILRAHIVIAQFMELYFLLDILKEQVIRKAQCHLEYGTKPVEGTEDRLAA